MGQDVDFSRFTAFAGDKKENIMKKLLVVLILVLIPTLLFGHGAHKKKNRFLQAWGMEEPEPEPIIIIVHPTRESCEDDDECECCEKE